MKKTAKEELAEIEKQLAEIEDSKKEIVESKKPFAGLKDSILSAIKGKNKKTKIDMAYLKATVQDSLLKKPRDISKIDRVNTGIQGFDQIIEGGFIPESAVLLTGGPGSGKSIFAMQYLINGIDKFGENGVYISFEEEPENLITYMKRFDWNIEQKIKDKKLAILYYSPEQVDRVVTIGGGPVREVIEAIQAKRVIIDSVSAFTLLYSTENEQRRALINLFKTLRKWMCTTLLISEQTLSPTNHISSVEEYQSEGVIFIYHSRKGDIRERSIEVFKMRGIDHSKKIFPLKISSEGIIVYPDQNVY